MLWNELKSTETIIFITKRIQIKSKDTNKNEKSNKWNKKTHSWERRERSIKCIFQLYWTCHLIWFLQSLLLLRIRITWTGNCVSGGRFWYIMYEKGLNFWLFEHVDLLWDIWWEFFSCRRFGVMKFVKWFKERNLEAQKFMEIREKIKKYF